MPELPEVETVRRGLDALIVGQKILAVSADTPKSFPNATQDVAEFLVGAEITAISRRAKLLLIELSSNYTLIIHLKMTGQLVFIRKPKAKSLKLKAKVKTTGLVELQGDEERWGAGHPSDSLIGELPDRSTRVIFTLDKGKLFFNDQRKFGWVKLYPTSEVPNIGFMMKVGPEPLADDFTAADFIERLLRRKNSNIKAVLLDQTVIAGVGNIYADESLWGAKIHPLTLVRNVSTAKLKTLFNELQFVLRLSIEKGGSTDRNYVNAEGKKGSYIDFARVFRREGKACPRCGREIIKLRVAGRGTHICSHCQKLPKDNT